MLYNFRKTSKCTYSKKGHYLLQDCIYKGEWYSHNGYEAACQRYAYYPGRITKRVNIESTRFHVTIHEGYHSYRSLKVLKEEQKRWDDSLIGIKMIIPKGTLYYKNDREYVSERLKCVEPLK